MSLYDRTADIAGVAVRCKPRVRSWEGWPDDVRETLRSWNRNGRSLSFRGLDLWGGYATGFAQLTRKCSECGCFFNNSGTTSCWLKSRWVCDDCIVDLARAA